MVTAGCSRQSPNAPQSTQPATPIAEVPAKAVRGISRVPGRLIREIDPLTPINDASDEARIAAHTINQKVAELDVQTFNLRLAELGDLLFVLQRRIESVPPDIGEQVARRVNEADVAGVVSRAQAALDSTSPALQEAECLIAEARQQLAQVDLPNLNTTVDSIQKTVRTIGERVDQFDIAGLNRVIAQAQEIRSEFAVTLRELSATLAETRGTIASMPLVPIATEAHSVAVRTGSLTTGLLVAVWLLNGLLALLIAATIRRWMVRPKSP